MTKKSGWAETVNIKRGCWCCESNSLSVSWSLIRCPAWSCHERMKRESGANPELPRSG